MSASMIRLATLADKDAIFHVHYQALMQHHEFYGALFKTHPRELLPMLTERALKNPTFVYLAAELEGSVVGFIRYSIVEAQDPDAAEKKAEDENIAKEKDNQKPPRPPLISPKDHLKEIWDRFNKRDEEMDACKQEAVKGQRHYYIWHLMIHPDYQRKGIGAKLLQAVTEKADADALPTLIVSSEMSHGLYLKAGFEELGVWTIDTEYWAQEIVQRNMSLGIKENEDLAGQFEGVKEVEGCLIRRPRNRG
ncbi:acyl-CoA N-acyltransferase [Ilyonectria sp. MPI-CAGE-AT-0026]|nr:acyl-CoA N-acyltransferase [Ilyonectria sp. MPI-CAGE-AT-0026]